MTIQEAINDLRRIKSSDEYVNTRLACIIEDLTDYMMSPSVGASSKIRQDIKQQIESKKSCIDTVDRAWVNNLYGLILNLFRYEQCKEHLKESKGKIDGETAQWVTTVVQGLLGVVSVVFTFLFAFEIIPKTAFGVLGENSDAFYYIIGTISQQALALIIAIVIGIINRCRRKNMYKNADCSFDELLAVKYENEPKVIKVLPPKVVKIIQKNKYGDNIANQTINNYSKVNYDE